MSDRLPSAARAALDAATDELAIVYRDQPYTWRYLAGVAAEIRAVLTAARVADEALIGFVPRNRPVFCAALLELIAERRSVAMVYPFQSAAALAADLGKLSVPVVIADAQDWTEETLAAVPVGSLAVALDSAATEKPVVRVVKGGLDVDRGWASSGDPRLEMLTSGTTGEARRHALSYATIEQTIIGNSVLDDSGSRPSDGVCVAFPISNISGIYSYLAAAVAGRPAALMEKFNVPEWLSFVRRFRPQIAVLPPAGLRMLLDAETPGSELESVKFVITGTSPVDPEVHARFENHFGVTLLLSYGATEFGGAATAMTADLHARYGRAKFGSVGKPQPGNDVRVVDPETDAPLATGQVGRLMVKIGAVGDDYIRTTDLGVLDEDGFLYIKGRLDGVIMRGGFKILPASIETVLNTFPNVSASIVVGLPDPRLGQVPAAVLEMKPGASAPAPAELEAYVRAALPSTHVPVAFRVVDKLPRTPSFKVDMRAAAALLERESA